MSDVGFHGLGRGRLRGRGIEHPFRGIASVDLDATRTLDRCRAYEPLLDSRHFFSHTTSAALFGIPLPKSDLQAPLHVSGLDTSTSCRRADIAGHVLNGARFRVMLRLGLPVISAADTFVQLARMLCFADLIAAGDFLITGPRRKDGSRRPALVTLAELQLAVLRHAGGRGVVAAASALPLLRTGVDSRPETHLRLLLIDAGFPEPVPDVETLVDHGRLKLHADLTIVEYRVVIEYEGDEHRLSARRFRADITRRELFEAAGWRVIRATAADLYGDPGAFIERVRGILRRRERA